MPRYINRLTLVPIYIMVMTLVIKFVVLKNYNIGLDEKSVISILLAEVSVILFWRPKEYVVESKVGITKDVTKAIIVFIGLNYLLSMNSLNPETPSKIKVIYIMILAPIAEELIFRGLCIDQLDTEDNTKKCLYSSLLFGLFHFSFTQAIIGFTVGYYLAVIRIKYNSIALSMVIHILLNIIALHDMSWMPGVIRLLLIILAIHYVIEIPIKNLKDKEFLCPTIVFLSMTFLVISFLNLF